MAKNQIQNETQKNDPYTYPINLQKYGEEGKQVWNLPSEALRMAVDNQLTFLRSDSFDDMRYSTLDDSTLDEQYTMVVGKLNEGRAPERIETLLKELQLAPRQEAFARGQIIMCSPILSEEQIELRLQRCFSKNEQHTSYSGRREMEKCRAFKKTTESAMEEIYRGQGKFPNELYTPAKKCLSSKYSRDPDIAEAVQKYYEKQKFVKSTDFRYIESAFESPSPEWANYGLSHYVCPEGLGLYARIMSDTKQTHPEMLPTMKDACSYLLIDPDKAQRATVLLDDVCPSPRPSSSLYSFACHLISQDHSKYFRDYYKEFVHPSATEEKAIEEGAHEFASYVEKAQKKSTDPIYVCVKSLPDREKNSDGTLHYQSYLVDRKDSENPSKYSLYEMSDSFKRSKVTLDTERRVLGEDSETAAFVNGTNVNGNILDLFRDILKETSDSDLDALANNKWLREDTKALFDPYMRLTYVNGEHRGEAVAPGFITAEQARRAQEQNRFGDQQNIASDPNRNNNNGQAR